MYACKVITQAIVLCLIYTHTTPKGECLYIWQSTINASTSACVIANMLHFRHSKICSTLKSIAQLLILQTLTVIVGGIFDIFITFPNVSMMYPIAVLSIMGLNSH